MIRLQTLLDYYVWVSFPTTSLDDEEKSANQLQSYVPLTIQLKICLRNIYTSSYGYRYVCGFYTLLCEPATRLDLMMVLVLIRRRPILRLLLLDRRCARELQ